MKEVIKLREARERKKTGLMVIEGRAEILMALNSGIELVKFFFCPELAVQFNFKELKIDKVYVSVNVFKKLSLRENPDGCLAVAKEKVLKLDEIKLKDKTLILVLQGLEKPGNVGAIMRTADAAAIDVVLVCDPQTDIYNHNVIRSSLGTVFSNQVVCCNSSEAINWLKTKKIKILATTPTASKIYTNNDYRLSSAIVIGTEHQGLTEEWFKAADEKVKIPMSGKIDSLNASVSAAIIIFEIVRQRAK
jgi:TrmH family RNA methyltransferase